MADIAATTHGGGESLAGKVAIVTGASSGIGRAMARDLVGRGCRVALAARRTERLRQLADELGDAALAVPADISSRAHVDRLVAATRARFGKIDIVYANAGLFSNRPFAEEDPAVIDAVLATNVAGVMHCAHAAIPHLRDNGGGDILIVGSIAGLTAMPGEAVYSASKHAVRAFAEILRRQLIGDNIRVGHVAPGTVATELWGLTDDDAIRTRVEQRDAVTDQDVVNASIFMLTQPRHVAIRDVTILPQAQDI